MITARTTSSPLDRYRSHLQRYLHHHQKVIMLLIIAVSTRSRHYPRHQYHHRRHQVPVQQKGLQYHSAHHRAVSQVRVDRQHQLPGHPIPPMCQHQHQHRDPHPDLEPYRHSLNLNLFRNLFCNLFCNLCRTLFLIIHRALVTPPSRSLVPLFNQQLHQSVAPQHSSQEVRNRFSFPQVDSRYRYDQL